MRGKAKRHNRRVTALILLCLALLFIGGCAGNTGDASKTGENLVACGKDEFSAYPEVLSQILPDYTVERIDIRPFRHLRNGQVTEAFGAQAASAMETGIAEHWYPHYLATMVIAVDRDLTNAQINSWSDLPGAGEEVGFFGVSKLSFETLLSAIAYGLQGEDYSLKSGAALLARLKAQGRLLQNSYEAPILICYDYTAAALMKNGRNLEIIVPSEGTLSYEKGLLSTHALAFGGNAEALLLAGGFRLMDGRCDTAYYPGPEAYENAQAIRDYTHFNTESYDATRIIRREVLGVRLYSSADGREHQYFVLLYIMLVTVWTISIVHRAIQGAVRRAALYTGITLTGWIIARFISYQLDNVGMFNLTFWYSYYIFQLTLPMVILWLAWVIDKPEGRTPLPGWMRALHLTNAILLLLVLSNNLHQWVFVLNLGEPKWSTSFTYTYGFVFYLVQAACWLPLVAGVVMLLVKGRHGLRKRGVWFVSALFGLLVLYAVGYMLRVPIAWESDITMTVGVFVLLLFEACIRSGIIPVNSRYTTLFAHSPLSMQITNQEGAAVLSSEYANTRDKALYAGSFAPSQSPLHYDENTLLFSDKISGGYVYWKEDIAKAVRLHKEIEESVRRLKAANALLEKEETIKRAVSEEISRTQLMKQLEDEIAGHITRLNVMTAQLANEARPPKQPARVILLLAYIKRRCNLFFREQEAPTVPMDELAVCIDELSELAAYSGVRIIFTCELSGNIPVRRGAVFYDYFYQVLDWAAGLTDLRILAHLGPENGGLVLRMLPSEDARSFRLDESVRAAILSDGGSHAVKQLDDGAAGLSLSFPEGGELDG